MSALFKHTPLIIFLLFIAGVDSSSAQWKMMRKFSDPIACAYFFDENNGLIGMGNYFQKDIGPLAIYWTPDGGVNWNKALNPLGSNTTTGWVTSIFMQDQTVGYASIFSDNYSVWKTTDGGKTWSDFSQGNQQQATCFYPTSKAFTETNWPSNSKSYGGNSIDGGKTYAKIFRGGVGASNGIDFSDDNIGVATMGPDGTPKRNRTTSWYTNDGGVNWQQGNDLPESWSVYALKGTKTFVLLSEDDKSRPGNTVYWSTDGGNNWVIRNNSAFSNFAGIGGFTGHIAGVRNTIYVQTDIAINSGLYRSDDLGLTWKSVGGPSNFRDTRFAVTGCKGQVVYAFGDDGEVWKTTNGGDGTLIGGSTVLSLLRDSLYIETRYCQPVRWYIDLINPGCDPLTIDALAITPNPYNEFSLDTNISVIQFLVSASSLRVPVVFHSDSNVTRHALLHIRAHAGGFIIDTTVILVAKHSTAPEPYLADLKATKAGDTVLVPVFLKATQDSFAIKHYSFHLSYDGDILTPARVSYETRGTLSALGAVTIGSPEANGILCTVDFTNPLTQDSDLTHPLIYLRMGVTLSRNTSCPVRMDTFALSNTAPLPLCTIPVTEFVIDPECGENILTSFMFDGTMPSLLSVHPNPNSGTTIEADVSLAEPGSLTLDIIGARGQIIAQDIHYGPFSKGQHSLKIETSGIPSGIYYLRLRTDSGSYSAARVVISR